MLTYIKTLSNDITELKSLFLSSQLQLKKNSQEKKTLALAYLPSNRFNYFA